MGKEQAVTDPHGVPTGSVPRSVPRANIDTPTCRSSDKGACERAIGGLAFCPGGTCSKYRPRSPWGSLMHEEPTKEQIANYAAVTEFLRPATREEKISNPSVYQVPANTKQIAGDHYKGKGIQPWDYVAANNLGYFEGTAIKYLTRWKDKGGVDDLKKAVHFIEKLIELQS